MPSELVKQELSLRLHSVGLCARDVFTVGGPANEKHFEIGGDGL